MGIIARQSFKAGIVTYFSVIIGIVNQIFIYPFILTVSQYGEIQFILQTAGFFVPFVVVGLSTSITKFYPLFSDSSEHRNIFYGFVFTVLAVNTSALILIFSFLNTHFAFADNNTHEVSSISLFIIVCIGALLPWQIVFTSITATKGRITVPAALNQSIKIFLPAVVLLYYFNFLNFTSVLLSLLLFHVFISLIFFIYTNSLERIKLKFAFRKILNIVSLKKIATFSAFSMFTGIGVTLTNQIDIIMITVLKSSHETGLYSWALFTATAISLPYSIVASIGTPVISKNLNSGNLDNIKIIYKSSSSTLLLISIGLFLTLLVGLDDIFYLMPKGDAYSHAKQVVILLGLSKIIDLATGLNSHIISMSRFYKYLLWFLLFSAAINVGLNSLLIPRYGIAGSAIATVVSISTFNILKYYFIKIKFGLTPFTYKTAYIVLTAIVLFIIVQLLPNNSNHFFNLCYKMGSFVFPFLYISYKLKFSQDINTFVNKQLVRIKFKPFD